MLEVKKVERRGSRGVARDDHHLDVVLRDEQLGDLLRELTHVVKRTGPVGVATGVTEVHEVFVGQEVDEGASDGESPEAAVEHADGTVVHGALRGSHQK